METVGNSVAHEVMYSRKSLIRTHMWQSRVEIEGYSVARILIASLRSKRRIVRFVKVMGYSSGRGPRSKRARDISQYSIAPDYGYKRRSTNREALYAYTQPEGIGYLVRAMFYAWTVQFWKLLNQNLTIQATESDERYPRSTVFNVLEGQTEHFVANFVLFLRNSPLSSKLYTLHNFSPL